ncbi:hypothetical protein EK21DRAFT_62708 [Setomelanomma holmii]|uniref:Uncharacterized protein n=1 Tax=Setomelanomma holmii TaxID=210430 RepID=A0A9P4HCB4_9PLEO|nr:hypothetical protein EK21DRAFT_62708 [Setomelanomma holmii]
MTIESRPETHMALKASSAINSLIATANKNDRLHLLEDDSVLPADLDNPIHPIFCWFDCDGSLSQMLRLASHFLTHDTVLEFFVPLLYGREMVDTDSSIRRTYLSNPLAYASTAKREELLDGVRQALHCLAHSIQYRFMKPERRVYARTLTDAAIPAHASSCSAVFQRRLTARIELADHFIHFHESDDGYAASSRCAQFRHDFLFASTLVHEIVHALGVMRRGNLVEPHIHADHPDTEWGYAWEHFVFGCIINPQDRTRPGTHLLMRKIWADPKLAEEAGGKEYSDVSMSYIAQWFRKETWDIIAARGPTAIPPPIAHFKIQTSQKYGAWIVSSNCSNIKEDINRLHKQWRQQIAVLDAKGLPISTCSKIFWVKRTRRALQRANVPIPSRTHRKARNVSRCGLMPKASQIFALPDTLIVKESTIVCQVTASEKIIASRKRPADDMTDSSRARKMAKTEIAVAASSQPLQRTGI